MNEQNGQQQQQHKMNRQGFWTQNLDNILTFTSDENSKQQYQHDDETSRLGGEEHVVVMIQILKDFHLVILMIQDLVYQDMAHLVLKKLMNMNTNTNTNENVKCHCEYK